MHSQKQSPVFLPCRIFHFLVKKANPSTGSTRLADIQMEKINYYRPKHCCVRKTHPSTSEFSKSYILFDQMSYSYPTLRPCEVQSMNNFHYCYEKLCVINLLGRQSTLGFINDCVYDFLQSIYQNFRNNFIQHITKIDQPIMRHRSGLVFLILCTKDI